MIKIEFVHYTETKSGTSYHTVSGLKSVKVDPQSVKGIDYHSIESRKAKFSFYDDSSFFSTYFLTNWTFIPDMKYNIFAIRLTKDGTTEYIGYVKPDNVIYDVKTGMVNISATDILGVLLELSDTDNDYGEVIYDVNDLLESEIAEILDGFDFDYSDISDSLTYSVTDSEIVFDDQGNFEEVEGYDGLHTISATLYEARIRSVTWTGTYFEVKIADYQNQRSGIGSHTYLEILKWTYFYFTPDLIIRGYQYNVQTDLHTSLSFTLFNSWVNGDYGTATSNSSAGVPSGNNSVSFGSGTDGIRMYFTGTLTLDKFAMYDTDNEFITINRKSLIKALLLILNASIRIEKDGDIIIEDKDTLGTGTDIDSYTLENKKGFILHSERDFNEVILMPNWMNIANALKSYYSTLFETFKYEYNLSINSDVSLSLGDTITSDGKDMRIVEIDEPYNEDIYYIKAWGE